MSQLTRRALLRNAAAASGTAVVGSTAGCMDSVPFVGGGGNAPEPGSTVPDDAEGLVSMDFAGMLNDADVKEVANSFLGGLSEMDGYSGPKDVDTTLD